MDNEYLDLPDDPEEAFAELHRRRISILEDVWKEEEASGRHSGYHHEREYIDVMRAFDEVMDLGLLTSFPQAPSRDNDFWDYFQDFRRAVQLCAQKILIESARRQKVGVETIVVLDASARSAIHHLIERIREHLNSLSIPEDKRDALFNKLNTFAAEVDRNRTRAEGFYAFAIDTARAARQVNDELKPLQQTIDKVFEWIDKAKRIRDALPPWSERKQIEAPKKELPKPSESDSDDEIPF